MLLTISVVLLVVVFAFVRAQTRPKNSPPGPFRLPVIGNFHQFGKKPHESLPALAKKHGGLFSLQLGHRFCVVLADYEAVHAVLKRRSTQTGGRVQGLTPMKITNQGKGIVLSMFDTRNAQTRKMLHAHVFSMQRLLTFESKITDEIKAFANLLATAASAQTPIEMTDVLKKLTFDITTRLILGDVRAPENEQRFHEFPKLARDRLSLANIPIPGDYVSFLKILPKPPHLQRLKEIVDFHTTCIRAEVAYHTKSLDKERPRSLLDLMLIARDADENKADRNNYYADENITYILYDLFIGGTDTTATTVEWFMAIMTAYPQVLAKMQAELDSVLGKRLAAWEDQKSLPYTNAVIKEVMRFRPIAQFFVHTASDDVTVSYKGKEYDIPKGTILCPLYGALHMTSPEWDKPDQFLPERFLNISVADEANMLIPFGVGVRQCLGINLAHVELFLIISHLAQQFTWSAPDGGAVDLAGSLVALVYGAKPYKLVFNKRQV